MLVNDTTRRVLAFRREKRDLTRQGYRRHETDWEIHRGGRWNEVIVDAKISVDGKYVYTKLGKPEGLAAQRAHECGWTFADDDTGAWRSDCGVVWVFIDGGPSENEMRHCCGCGKKLKERHG